MGKQAVHLQRGNYEVYYNVKNMLLSHDIGCTLEEDQKHLHEFKTSNSIFKSKR